MNKKKQRGRPQKEINLDQLAALRAIGATDTEISAFFGVSHDVLDRRKKSDPEFLEVYEESFSKFKLSLRRNLLKLSETNASAAIFLAKNVLGMRDDMGMRHEGGIVIKVSEMEVDADLPNPA